MDALDKKFYKIGEVAQMLEVPLSTLRFWESEFPFIKPERNARGTRFYTPQMVERITMVKYLVKERGMHIDAAREAIRSNPQGVQRRALAVARLRDMRARIAALLDALNSLR